MKFRSTAVRAALASLALLCITVLIGAGCSTSSTGGSGSGTPAQAESSAGKPYLFDGKTAFGYLASQCAFGIRDPVTPGHGKCLDYIRSQLDPYSDAVADQNFTFRDDSRHVTLHLTNIIGVINPSGKPRIMISAHWDTRPTADMDFNPANRDKPILGADDGASGVAVLIELARVLHAERPSCCVELVCWDGEDWGPGEDKMYLGARWFAAHPDPARPDESILLDMIGQKNLLVPKEAWSAQNYPKLTDDVWQAAAEAGEGAVFPATVGPDIDDDQIPLAKMGIPSIDLIDFNYADWHQLTDTVDKCSPDSLDAVGKTLEQYVRDVDANPSYSPS
jgi:glutaminyl-peptide cyclotransferase